MQHLSEDALIALALGESGEHDSHVDRCDACAVEAAALRATADCLRAAHVEPVVPPALVWERIVAEITVTDTEADAAVVPPPAVAAGDAATPASEVPASEVPASEVPASEVPARDLVRRRRRRFSGRALLVACAASAAVAATLVVLVLPFRGAASTNLGAAALQPLTPIVSTASAAVVERDGQRLLVVDVDSLPEVDGYLDVWLLDAEAQQMVSLGVMDAQSTQLALPPGLDLATYPIVDVSIEPYDGDPTHSGNSIWRGALEL